jgi:hypothetical protein
MTQAYTQLLSGLAFAIVLIYLLIVVNFQSWTDPAVIVLGLPGALAGIVWMLFLTNTTLSVPALTGAIMCMGVATANSILVISFARERMESGMNALDAAMEAGATRFRPVLMTALAMIIGDWRAPIRHHRHLVRGAEHFQSGARAGAARAAGPRAFASRGVASNDVQRPQRTADRSPDPRRGAPARPACAASAAASSWPRGHCRTAPGHHLGSVGNL